MADTPVPKEEKQMATWGTEVPADLVLDKKLLAEALKKVSFSLSLSLINLFLMYSNCGCFGY